jgi:NAD(P)-dependent dehydrogenase (short-subunit alcohol dehydrogenase family)
VVTGANTGLGFQTAQVLAARGATVVLAVRDVEKGKHAAARIAATAPGANLTVQPLDLAWLDSVRAAAAELRATHPTIDLLVNNAGVMSTPVRGQVLMSLVVRAHVSVAGQARSLQGTTSVRGLEAVLEAVAGAADGDDVAVVQQPVQDG